MKYVKSKLLIPMYTNKCLSLIAYSNAAFQVKAMARAAFIYSNHFATTEHAHI